MGALRRRHGRLRRVHPARPGDDPRRLGRGSGRRPGRLTTLRIAAVAAPWIVRRATADAGRCRQRPPRAARRVLRRARSSSPRSSCSASRSFFIFMIAASSTPRSCARCRSRSSASRPRSILVNTPHRRPAADRRGVDVLPRDHRRPDRRHRRRRGRRREDHRAERGAPPGARPARGGDDRERRPPRPAADPGPRGGHPRRAAAHGPRDPRHHRPGPDRHRHPARGGRPGARPAGRSRPAPRERRSGWPGRASPRRAARSRRRCPRRSRPGTLPDALADVAREWSEINAIPVEVAVTGDVIALHPEIDVALLRIAQEALANVARHAGRLARVADAVVHGRRRDAGRPRRRGGLPASTERGSGDGAGFGLTGMRQRVARVAGSLAIESEPGGGTAVVCPRPGDRRRRRRRSPSP